MKRPWQFSLSGLLLGIVVLSIIVGLLARFGDVAYIALMGGTVLACVVAIARGESGIALGSLICFLLLVAGSSFFHGASYVWDGYRTVPLEFIVIDAVTEKPIAGANIRLREKDMMPPPALVPPGEKGIDSKTGSDGTLVLHWDCIASGREGTFEHIGHVFFNNQGLWIQASAPGYETQLTSLRSLTGMSLDISDRAPPRMQVLLTPTKPHQFPVKNSP